VQRREERRRAQDSADSCCFPPTFTFDFGRFVTKNGTKVCSKPNAPWVKKAVKYLQKKNNPQAV